VPTLALSCRFGQLPPINPGGKKTAIFLMENNEKFTANFQPWSRPCTNHHPYILRSTLAKHERDSLSSNRSLAAIIFSLFFFSIIPRTGLQMTSSISDPFLLASYSISKRLLDLKPSKNPDLIPSANVHITHTDSKSDGYATATVQGDGIHLLDVRPPCHPKFTRSRRF